MAVFCGITSVLLSSWPFIGALYIPLALDVLRTHGLLHAIALGVRNILLVVTPILLIDRYYYQKFVLPPWNTFAYNVLGGSSGSQSELYGTEPWWFYLLNCTLNLNVAFACGLLGAPAVLYCHRDQDGSFSWSLFYQVLPMYIWFGIMNTQAHKEERFIFPIYPLFCLSAALALAPLVTSISEPVGHRVAVLTRLLGPTPLKAVVAAILLLGCAMSVARTSSVIHNYSAPLAAYQHLHDHLELEHRADRRKMVSEKVVCVGKEWFRYPASFFLPAGSPHLRFGFVKSSFGGQLPAPFQALEGTSKDGGLFNDKNQAEEDRYTPLEQCSYYVDLELENQKEEKLSTNKDWDVLIELPFLDASKSKSLYRAFYIPFMSAKHTTFARYLVLKRKLA